MSERTPREWWKDLLPGDAVLCRRDDGTETSHIVKYAPWSLGSGHVVVGLSGIVGGYSIDRVRRDPRAQGSANTHFRDGDDQ